MRLTLSSMLKGFGDWKMGGGGFWTPWKFEMLTFYYIYLYVKESSHPPSLMLKNTCIYPPLEFQKILPGSAPVIIITRYPKGTQHGVTKEKVVHILLDCIVCP